MIPENSPYSFLNNEPAPRHLLEAIKLYGIKEGVGAKDNPIIIEWAKECGLGGIYKEDSMPWCGLFVSICLHRAGRDILPSTWDNLRALKWGSWGLPARTAMLGDILVFQRPGGGHVGFYVGEDEVAYHVLGGNQGDMVSVTRISKSRMVAISRPKYNNQPENIRIVKLMISGKLSENEA